MKSGDALLDAWDETLSRCSDGRAIYNTRAEVLRTFGDIELRAAELETELARFAAGEVVAIQIGNHPDWPSLLLACLRRKVIAVPLEQSITEQQRNAALEVCRCSAVAIALASGELQFHLFERVGAGPPSGRPGDDEKPARERAGSIAWGGNPPVLLKLTSGTTAAPRAIRFRSEQLLADCENICDTMGITDADVNFGVIPVSHSYGFSNLITPLIARGVPIVLSNDRMPRAVLEDVARTNATVLPGTPVLFQALCEMKEPPELPVLRLWISAGAPLAATVAQRFFENFKQPIHSFYGSSECGGICYDNIATKFENGFVGGPMNGVTLKTRLRQATARQAVAPSQIEVRSAAVADGYFPEADESKLGNGLFVPDDLLERSDGGFRIVGRVSDIINVGGKKVNPAEVEGALLKMRGVREAVVFGRKSAVRQEEVVACVVADGVTDSALMAHCRAELSDWQSPKRIFFVNKMPVTERGKISRRELAEHFAQR